MESPVTIIHVIMTFCLFKVIGSSTYQAINVNPVITAVPNDIPVSTTHVIITRNKQLISLPANIFISHVVLTNADFSNNNISFIHPDAFKGTIVHTLLLYDNYLMSVPLIDYIGTTLTILNLSWNVLMQVPTGSLVTYPNIVELDISVNPLFWSTTNLDGLLSVVGSLHKLTLDRTSGPASPSLADLSTYAFQNLTKLRMSTITRYPNLAYMNSSVTHFDMWNLSQNSLTNSLITGFNANITVKELVLSYNSLTAMPDFSYSGWKSLLTSLILDHNNIAQVDSSVLTGMSNLVTLDISSNQITTFPNFSTTGNNQLNQIDLRHNLISYVSAGSLYNMPLLTSLWLDNNPLLLFEDINNVLPSFSYPLYIGLTGVQFVCNCSYTFIMQATQTGYTNLTVAVDTLPCTSPSTLTTVNKQDLQISYICSNATCDPIPTWIDIRTNAIGNNLGQTIQYYCREGYLFTTTSGADDFKTSTCHILTGDWDPDFHSCTEYVSPEEEAKFNEATDSPHAEVIGIFTIIFVCAEMGILLAMDLHNLHQCCKRCKSCTKKTTPSKTSPKPNDVNVWGESTV